MMATLASISFKSFLRGLLLMRISVSRGAGSAARRYAGLRR